MTKAKRSDEVRIIPGMPFGLPPEQVFTFTEIPKRPRIHRDPQESPASMCVSRCDLTERQDLAAVLTDELGRLAFLFKREHAR